MKEEIILDKFAERFSSLIKNSSLEIPDIAQKLGLKSISTIYRYMNAEMSPKIPTVKYAAEIFNVNPLWLMGQDAPMERELPYSAIYDFSTDNEKNILNDAIVYIIQNNIGNNEMVKNEYINDLLTNLNTIDKETAVRFIQYFANKYKGMHFFNLAECIASLQYYKDEQNSNPIDNNEAYTPKARVIARGFDKLPPDKQDLYTQLLNSMLEDDKDN